MPTPDSKPASGSAWPTPRMKAVRVEFVAREAFSVVLGSVVVSATTSGMPCLDSWSAVKAVTETGTSCSVSRRRRALTTTFSTLPSGAATALLVLPESWAWTMVVPDRASRAAAERLSSCDFFLLTRIDVS